MDQIIGYRGIWHGAHQSFSNRHFVLSLRQSKSVGKQIENFTNVWGYTLRNIGAIIIIRSAVGHMQRRRVSRCDAAKNKILAHFFFELNITNHEDYDGFHRYHRCSCKPCRPCSCPERENSEEQQGWRPWERWAKSNTFGSNVRFLATNFLLTAKPSLFFFRQYLLLRIRQGQQGRIAH